MQFWARALLTADCGSFFAAADSGSPEHSFNFRCGPLDLKAESGTRALLARISGATDLRSRCQIDYDQHTGTGGQGERAI